MKWTDCPLVETIPGKLSGAPVIVHSRVRPDDLIVNRDQGPEWQAENFALPVDTVRAVLAFYDEMTRGQTEALTALRGLGWVGDLDEMRHGP